MNDPHFAVSTSCFSADFMVVRLVTVVMATETGS